LPYHLSPAHRLSAVTIGLRCLGLVNWSVRKEEEAFLPTSGCFSADSIPMTFRNYSVPLSFNVFGLRGLDVLCSPSHALLPFPPYKRSCAAVPATCCWQRRVSYRVKQTPPRGARAAGGTALARSALRHTRRAAAAWSACYLLLVPIHSSPSFFFWFAFPLVLQRKVLQHRITYYYFFFFFSLFAVLSTSAFFAPLSITSRAISYLLCFIVVWASSIACSFYHLRSRQTGVVLAVQTNMLDAYRHDVQKGVSSLRRVRFALIAAGAAYRHAHYAIPHSATACALRARPYWYYHRTRHHHTACYRCLRARLVETGSTCRRCLHGSLLLSAAKQRLHCVYAMLSCLNAA